MSSARLLILTSALLASLVGCKHDGNKGEDDSVDPGPMPLAITGWGTDVQIAPDASDSQAEPTVKVLDDGTLLASWMDLNGYNLYVKWSRSTDGGRTWSEIKSFDKSAYPYQNDPVFGAGGGYVYFTYLLVENASASKSAVICLDSTDGGATWSDPVRITKSGDFVDRQWMDVDDSGRAIMSWDRFQGNLMYQDYSESTGGCAGFTDITTVTSGSFLNGVPVIDANGDPWVSRDDYDYRNNQMVVTLSHLVGGDWQDVKVTSQLVGAEAASAIAEDPQEEAEARQMGMHAYDKDKVRMPEWARHRPGERNPIEAGASGFDGFYSPDTELLADGSIGIVTAMYESGSTTTGDTVFYTVKDGVTTSGQILNQDDEGAQQMEPWMAVDGSGGIHTTWFDDREGDWRLYGATSIDGGATWNEYPVADATFKKGFNDYDTYKWVGHFQGLSANDTDLYAVWCDTRNSDDSFCYVDHGVE